MAARPLPLNETGAVTLDGSGNGTVRLAPDSSSHTWYPTIASVKCSSHIAEASCQIYVGRAPTADNFIDGTLSGSTGDSSDRVTGYTIARTRDPYIWAVWAGGDPGAQATLVINGTMTVGERA